MLLRKVEQRLAEEDFARKYLDFAYRFFRKLEKKLVEISEEVAEQGYWKPSQIHEENRLSYYLGYMKNEIESYNEELNLMYGKDYVSTYISEYGWTQQFLRRAYPEKAEIIFNTKVNARSVHRMLSGITIRDSQGRNRTLRSFLESYSKDLAAESEKILIDSIALGDSVERTVRELKNLHQSLARHRLETTVRTWHVKAHTDANIDVYKEAEIIDEVQWCAAMDTAVCARCAASDGQVFKLDQLLKKPPIHPRCRCCLLPIVDRGDIFRSEKDGYLAWLADDSRSEQWLTGLWLKVNRERTISSKEKRQLLGIINGSLRRKGVFDHNPTREDIIQRRREMKKH